MDWIDGKPYKEFHIQILYMLLEDFLSIFVDLIFSDLASFLKEPSS